MNERIQELIKQATEYYSNGSERIFDREKFAELLISECIDVVPWQYEEKIKQHFGVPE